MSLDLQRLRQIAVKELAGEPDSNLHLAVMAEPFLSLMLSGQKTTESRFSKNKIAPYGKIKTGDIVFLKATAGPVLGFFRAGNVQFLELDTINLSRIKQEYGATICADDAFWEMQKEKHYATLIEVTHLIAIPATKVAKNNRLGWMVVS